MKRNCRENVSLRTFSRLASVVHSRTARAICAAFCLLAALGLGACGGGESADLLPGSTAREIRANLAQVKQLASEGECVGARDAALAVSDQVNALGGVDQRLKAALREGAEKLDEALVECDEAEVEETETSPALSEAEEAEEAEAEEAEAEERKPKPKKSAPKGPEKSGEQGPEKEAPEKEQTAPPKQTTPEAETPSGGSEPPAGGVSPATPTGEE